MEAQCTFIITSDMYICELAHSISEHLLEKKKNDNCQCAHKLIIHIDKEQENLQRNRSIEQVNENDEQRK